MRLSKKVISMALPNTIANSKTGLNINTQDQSVTTLAGANYSVSNVNWSDLFGSKYADVITGSASAEAVNAGAGNDTIKGSDGADTINGGAGNDLVDYSASNSAVTLNLLNGNMGLGGDAAGDILTNVENITGTAFADNITGNASNNILTGGAGNDLLNGGRGADLLNGGAGVDTAVYSDALAGVNVNLAKGYGMSGEATGDRYSSIENVVGSNFNDNLTGDAGNNVLEGGKGNDYIIGGAGADTINGGEGIDTVSYAGATSKISLYHDYTQTGNVLKGEMGDTEGELVTNVEKIIGSSFDDNIGMHTMTATTVEAGAGNDNVSTGYLDDLLNGGSGNDFLYASGGNDTLIGGTGNDTLDGDYGHNILTGGAGNDTFNFSTMSYGNDTITDFQAGNNSGDLVDMNMRGVTNFQDLMSHGTQSGANTIFNFEGQKLTLQNVVMSQLNEGDFNIREFEELICNEPIFDQGGEDVLTPSDGFDVLVY